MKIESAELTELRELFTHGRRAKGSAAADCPPPGKIWEAVRGQATSAEVESLLEHTLDCQACAQDWRLARAVALEAELDEVRAPVGRFGRWGLAPAWLATAAVIVLAVFGLQQFLEQGSGPPAFRDPGQAPSAIQSLVPEGASLPRDNFLLKWRPGPEGALYTLRLVTEDLQPVTTARNLEASEYLVPGSALESVPSGARLFWEVRMESPDGSRSSSAIYSVRLGL